MTITTKAVTLSLDRRLLERIDERRGLVSRSAFIASLVEAGLGCSEKDGVDSKPPR
jgi:metal-responsive CopG/Arc/MetJ family transcriptional regulator